MKVQLESIGGDSPSPFRLMHSPRLGDLFYWHFHPEYELVFIEGASATRHVGNHISAYSGCDLVLIGSNIPHLNFDHGVQGAYTHEVLHIKPEFKTSVLDSYPELGRIRTLLQTSQYGIAFKGITREKAGEAMKKWHAMDPFARFTDILKTLHMLSASAEFELLHKSPYINRFKEKDQQRLRTIHAFIEERYAGKISLSEIADKCHLSREAFCRYFKKETGSTFITFLNQYRIAHARRMLMTGHSVSEACFSCGFESLSYFNRTFRNVTGENPSRFRKSVRKPA